MATKFSRYAAVHDPLTLNGPGDARPTALQIVQDNDLVGKLRDKTMLITGCSSGIGVETARALQATGATLYLTARDLSKARAALGSVLEATAASASNKVHLLQLDLNWLASVRRCAAEFLDLSSGQLHILICNAGIMGLPVRTTTADNFEAQLGTNHLAHFLLHKLLEPALLRSATASFSSRVVCVSSAAHTNCGINFSDMQLEGPGSYSPFGAYGQSKTANIYMATEIERRYGVSRNLHGYSLHPGGIKTGLQVHMDTSNFPSGGAVDKRSKSVEQGAATTVWAAVGKEWEGATAGKYLIDCQVAGPGKEMESVRDGYADWVYDEESAKRLWDISYELVGVEAD